eukprot:3235166-Rhodomonas_salina.6
MHTKHTRLCKAFWSSTSRTHSSSALVDLSSQQDIHRDTHRTPSSIQHCSDRHNRARSRPEVVGAAQACGARVEAGPPAQGVERPDQRPQDARDGCRLRGGREIQ